jgi:hypothetical protein
MLLLALLDFEALLFSEFFVVPELLLSRSFSYVLNEKSICFDFLVLILLFFNFVGVEKN